jgi:hypothetical protein
LLPINKFVQQKRGVTFVSMSVLTPALSSRRGGSIRRISENSRDWICQTTFRKTKNAPPSFLLPGGEGQDEGGCKTIIYFAGVAAGFARGTGVCFSRFTILTLRPVKSLSRKNHIGCQPRPGEWRLDKP